MTAQERFNASWWRYLDAVIVQAERRSCEYTCTIDEYLAARLDDAAGESCIAFMEICLGVDIPHAVMEHPTLVAMNGYLASLFGLGNVSLPSCIG